MISCRNRVCISFVNIQWKEHITSPSGMTLFNSFNDEKVSDPSKYKIYGEYNLVVKSVTLEDGGMYSCKLSFAETSANNVDLVVVGGDINATDER